MSNLSRDSADEAWANEQLADLDKRREVQRGRHYARQPKRLGNVVAQLVQRRGYAAIRAAGARDDAWLAVVSEVMEGNSDAWASSTRVAGLRRGTLEIQVANSLLMQELTFQKQMLIQRIQEKLPDEKIKQIKFTIGRVS